MDKEAIRRIADVADIDLLLAGAVLEELCKLGYRRLPKDRPLLGDVKLSSKRLEAINILTQENILY